jgi:hypothetical protein
MTHQNIADLLAEEAEQAEQHRDDELTTGYRRAHPPREPAQVYSLRIPVEQLEQLRSLAAARHLTPSALMRAWVLERLDAEPRGAAPPDDPSQHGPGSGALPQTLRLIIREELARASTGAAHQAEAPTRRRARQAPGRPRSADIRAWARQNGYKVTARGKIPATIVEEYEAAN